MDYDLISYQFSREKVERGDFSHFLSLYGPEKLPANRKLRDLMNRFVFCIEGWDDDPREIHTIPEIRRLYSAFHSAWTKFLTLQSFAALLAASFSVFEPETAGRQTRGTAKHVVEILRRVEPGLGGHVRR